MAIRYSFSINAVLWAAIACLCTDLHAQEHSIVRQWNEALLGAIRRDFARPPVQARNLYHVSAAMYEAWSAYDPTSEPFLLGRTRAGYTCPFDGIAVPADMTAARKEAISFAAYRILVHRFQNSPGLFLSMLEFNELMDSNGYDRNNTSTDYVNGGAAELGNYIAQQIIAYGFQDGSNEQFNHTNQYYSPLNIPMVVEEPGNPNMADPNRWQQLTLSVAIDQQGNPIPSTSPFQSPEWGNVDPFAMTAEQMEVHVRDGYSYKVYNDPGAPAYLDTTSALGMESFYKWNFCMVPIWQSHLDPADGVMIDISPASKGNIQSYPTTEEGMREFYDYYNGGDPSTGHTLNPVTGEPYAPQMVKRGDYTRILAEFWADGPNSETPPGHWYSIMNQVMDHPLFDRRWMGEGEELEILEYEVKAYLVLGGALHDAAITAWGIKGWYDYVRPISAIRYMAGKGQCSDQLQPNYHPAGMPLVPGYIELVTAGDPLAGEQEEHVGKVKLYTWLGPAAIEDPQTDVAGVGWVLAEDWYPYQRPTFVTPPFAGYISGHSTFSRSAAEVLTLITGNPYFPGGMSNFVAPQNDFLHFEQGPSEEIILQWATYRDASDQCSLSRIWGGIHPPVDDIPGRHLGMIIGPGAVDLANSLFNSQRPVVTSVTADDPVLSAADIGNIVAVDIVFDQAMDTATPPVITMMVEDPLEQALVQTGSSWVDESTFRLSYVLQDATITLTNIHMRIDSAISLDGKPQDVHLIATPFTIDTQRPQVASFTSSASVINEPFLAQNALELTITFDEACMPSPLPTVEWLAGADLSATLILDTDASMWLTPTTVNLVYNVIDNDEEVFAFGAQVSGSYDASGNAQYPFVVEPTFQIDTRGAIATSIDLSQPQLTLDDVAAQAFSVSVTFDEAMDPTFPPEFAFVGGGDPLGTSLIEEQGSWLDPYTYTRSYGLIDASEEFLDLVISVSNARDLFQNSSVQALSPSSVSIDTKRPLVQSATPSTAIVASAHTGTGTFSITIIYDEEMDQSVTPLLMLSSDSDLSGSLIHEPALDLWNDPFSFTATYTVVDEDLEVATIDIICSGARDLVGNEQEMEQAMGPLALDTREPALMIMTANTYTITEAHIGESGLQFVIIFDEEMDQAVAPEITFSEDLGMVIAPDPLSSHWLNGTTYRLVLDVQNITYQWNGIDVELSAARDLAGNAIAPLLFQDMLSVDITLVGLLELEAGAIRVYPNPIATGESLWLELKGENELWDLQLMDAHGRMVYTTRIMSSSPAPQQVSLPNVAQGAYLLIAENATLRLQERLMIIGR